MAVIDLIMQRMKNRSKGYFVLIDPEKRSVDLNRMVQNINRTYVDAILVGGSNKNISGFHSFIVRLKKMTDVPIVLFPGSHSQISKEADAILLLSLLNSRSLKHVIGEHIDAAETIVRSGIEVIPTAYIVMDKTGKTSVSRAAEVLKLKSEDDVKKYIYASSLMSYSVVYLEAGSGASQSISPSAVKIARRILDKPIIVGGGIKTPDKAKSLLKAGADIIVTGNAIEKNPDLILDFGALVKRF